MEIADGKARRIGAVVSRAFHLRAVSLPQVRIYAASPTAVTAVADLCLRRSRRNLMDVGGRGEGMDIDNACARDLIYYTRVPTNLLAISAN